MGNEFNKLKDFLNAIDCYPSEYELDELIGVAEQQSGYEANVGYMFKRTETNPREKAFYEQWLKENRPIAGLNFGQGILQDLFMEKREMFGSKCIEHINNRDRYIVATVIQWLGTNVGMGFLYEALKRFNARIVYDENKPKNK